MGETVASGGCVKRRGQEVAGKGGRKAPGREGEETEVEIRLSAR